MVVDWHQAALDPYTFLSVGMHDGTTWFGSSKKRGLAPGTGSLRVPVAWPQEEREFPRTVTIDVGLEAQRGLPACRTAARSLRPP